MYPWRGERLPDPVETRGQRANLTSFVCFCRGGSVQERGVRRDRDQLRVRLHSGQDDLLGHDPTPGDHQGKQHLPGGELVGGPDRAVGNQYCRENGEHIVEK